MNLRKRLPIFKMADINEEDALYLIQVQTMVVLDHLDDSESRRDYIVHATSVGSAQQQGDYYQLVRELQMADAEYLYTLNILLNIYYMAGLKSYPVNENVNPLNSSLMSEFPGEVCVFKSVDTAMSDDKAVQYPTEQFNSLELPGMPPHELSLKIGGPSYSTPSNYLACHHTTHRPAVTGASHNH